MTIATRRKFTVRDVLAMAEMGIFAPDERLELIRGELFEVTPPGSEHAGTVTYLNREFQLRLSDRAIVSVQNPLQLSELTLVEPDLMLLTPRDDFYTSAHPTAEDAFLVVEVSHSTLERDRDLKLSLYAEAGVPEVWIVNLVDDEIEVHGNPAGGRYESSRTVWPHQPLAPRSFPDLQVTVLPVSRS